MILLMMLPLQRIDLVRLYCVNRSQVDGGNRFGKKGTIHFIFDKRKFPYAFKKAEDIFNKTFEDFLNF